MALACRYGGRECDGCGRCMEVDAHRVVAICEHCGEAVLSGEPRYEFPDGEVVHDDCVIGYVRERYHRDGE